MSKCYYLCDVVGDGSDANPYRPAVANVQGINWAAVIAGNADGTLRLPWALCLVAARDHQVLLDAATNDGLPVLSLDAALNTLPGDARSKLNDALSRRALPTNPVPNSAPYRDLIRAVGRQLSEVFDENHFDTADV